MTRRFSLAPPRRSCSTAFLATSPMDSDFTRQVDAFHEAMVKAARQESRKRSAMDGRLADHLRYIEGQKRAKQRRKSPSPVAAQAPAWSPRWSSSRTFRRTKEKGDLATTEAAQLEKLIGRFTALLEAADAPVLQDVGRTKEPRKAIRGLLGGSRV